MRIIVFVLNTLIQLGIAAFGFFILIIVMNGYSEKQATPGIILYIILAILSALVIGAASSYTALRLLAKTSLGNFWSSTIAIIGFAAIGAVVLIISLFAAIFTAEALRK